MSKKRRSVHPAAPPHNRTKRRSHFGTLVESDGVEKPREAKSFGRPASGHDKVNLCISLERGTAEWLRAESARLRLPMNRLVQGALDSFKAA